MQHNSKEGRFGLKCTNGLWALVIWEAVMAGENWKQPFKSRGFGEIDDMVNTEERNGISHGL